MDQWFALLPHSMQVPGSIHGLGSFSVEFELSLGTAASSHSKFSMSVNDGPRPVPTSAIVFSLHYVIAN